MVSSEVFSLRYNLEFFKTYANRILKCRQYIDRPFSVADGHERRCGPRFKWLVCSLPLYSIGKILTDTIFTVLILKIVKDMLVKNTHVWDR